MRCRKCGAEIPVNTGHACSYDDNGPTNHHRDTSSLDAVRNDVRKLEAFFGELEQLAEQIEAIPKGPIFRRIRRLRVKP